ncbi:MAG: hypothetical protein JW910_09335 [Anaerolineae bacterium]|nr:hypothetical protein [Anaerolineae bacterium]
MNKYAILILVAVLALAACTPGPVEVAEVQADVLPRSEPVQFTGQSNSGLPDNRPTTPSMQNPHDPLAIVVTGEFGNGGYWAWDEIANLLGVYSSYGAFTETVLDGQEYPGVPLSYLLHYAELNSYADAITIVTREDQHYYQSVNSLRDCGDCLVARAPDDSLSLILPGTTPDVIHHLLRLEATPREVGLEAPVIPNDTSSVFLAGQFRHGGYWTWDDLSNLLGIYSSYGAYVSIVVDGQTYTGVPLVYLIEYAGLDPAANAIVVHNRSAERSAAAASEFSDCAACLVTLEADGTLTLVVPGMDVEVIPNLAGIEAR